MAIHISRPFTTIFVPGYYGGPEVTHGLITNTYTRKLTYGQIKGIKALLKMMKRLKVSKKLEDVAVNEIESNMGSPGVKCTYRVRIRYRE